MHGTCKWGKYNREFCFWTHLRNWVKLLSLVPLLAYANIRTTATLASQSSCFVHWKDIWTVFYLKPPAFTLIISGMLWNTKYAISYFVSTRFLFPSSLPLFFSPSLDWHTVWEMGFCIKQEVIEKCRKQIFSIRFWRFCPLTVQANVPIAKQSTSHFASDNSTNV